MEMVLGEPPRNWSLKISRETTPSYPVAAEVAAPVQQVHVDARRVSQLHEEDAVAGDRADRIRIEVARQGVEGIEDQADVRAVGATHDLPGVAVVVDVAAPGERLVADAEAAGGGTLAEFGEVGGGAVDAAERQRRDVGADQHEVGTQLAHQVELALGALEGAGALRLRHTLEVTERLEQHDLQPVVAHQLARLARRAVEGQEVVLEDLDAVEAGGGNGGQLLLEIAGDRDGCDGGLHRHATFVEFPPSGQRPRWRI